MTLKQYLLVMGLSTVMCVTAFIFILVNVDPTTDSDVGFSFFYASLFLSFIGVLSLFILAGLSFWSRQVPLFRHVQASFTIASILAGGFTLLTYLQGRGLLNIWNFVIFICIVLFLLLFKVSAMAYNKSH